MSEIFDSGHLLKAARIEANLSQDDLAGKLDTKFQHLSAWERGTQKIPEKTIPKLERELPNLNIKKLRIAMAWESDPFVVDDLSATEQFSRLIGDATGTVYAFSGKEAGFSNPRMVEGAKRFLLNKKNRVVFILAPLEDDIDKWAEASRKSVASDTISSLRALGRYSDSGEIKELRRMLTGNNAEVNRRVTFYSLILPRGNNQNAELTARLLPLSRLLFPLAVSILFEPDDGLSPRAGIIYIRRGLAISSTGDYIWIRLASDYLGQLSRLLKITFAAGCRSKFLKEITEKS
jgi:transcriptional regulator with XRE-family HTH domain